MSTSSSRIMSLKLVYIRRSFLTDIQKIIPIDCDEILKTQTQILQYICDSINFCNYITHI